MAEVLAETPIAQPSAELQLFRERRQTHKNFLECGVDAPTCGAMARLAPMLLYPWGSARIWPQAALVSYLTHRDAASLTSSLAWTQLLLRLMERSAAPEPGFYYNHFVAVLEQLEAGNRYPSQAPRYDGWNGTLSEYLKMLIPDARQRGLTFEEAWNEWGASHYLLESVPTLLYALELSGHQPRQCLQWISGVTGAREALGALAGAALGALHGVQRHWDIPGPVTQTLNDYRQHLGL